MINSAIERHRHPGAENGTDWWGWGSGRSVDADSLSRTYGSVEASSAAVAVEALFRLHRVRLTRLARAITLDAELAQEITQDAFVGLQRRWSAISAPEGYLQRSVVNASIKALRRRGTASRYVWPPVPLTEIPEIDETWLAVTHLAPKQRAVVVLRFWADMSEADIAATLGWRPGTVKSSLHRALASLRKEIVS